MSKEILGGILAIFTLCARLSKAEYGKCYGAEAKAEQQQPHRAFGETMGATVCDRKVEDLCVDLASLFLESMVEYENTNKLTLFHDEIINHKSIMDLTKNMSKKAVLTRAIKIANDSDALKHVKAVNFLEHAIYVIIAENGNTHLVLNEACKMNLVTVNKEHSRMWILVTNDIDEILVNLNVGINSRMIYVTANDSSNCDDGGLELNALIHSFYENRTQLKKIGQWTPEDLLSIKQPAISCCENVAGAMLKIATIHQPPWTFITEDENGKYHYSGLLIDVLQILAESLKIKYEISYKRENDFGSVRNSDSTWTGIIGELQQKKADIGLTLIEMSEDKLEVVDFSPTLLYDGPTILISTPTHYFNWTGYLLPFNYRVWMLITVIFTIVWTGLIISCKKPIPFGPNLWMMISISEQQGAEEMPSGNSSRIFFATYAFFTLLMVQMYNSIVISFLTVSRSQLPFTDIQGLISSDYRWVVQTGSDMEKRMDKYFPAGFKKDQIEEKKVQIQTAEEGVKVLSKYSEVAFLGLQHEAQYVTRDTCNYTFINLFTDKDLTYLRIVYTKNSVYQAPINNQLTKMVEGGIIRKLLKKYTQSTTMCEPIGELHPFTLNEVILPFLFLMAGTGLSIIICFAEIFVKKSKIKQNYPVCVFYER